MRILVVEDDDKMARLLKKGLEEEKHSVMTAAKGPDGLQLARTGSFEVIVLDVMLPGLSGFEIARRLREFDVRTPILMLTARDAVPDVVKGLNLGADDYLTKPFAFDELLARLRAIARRGPVKQLPKLRMADLVLDPATHQVLRGGAPIRLTRTEYLLLEFMLLNAGHVLSRTAIIEAVWGFGEVVENNTLDAFIRLLRNKIDNSQPVKLIHTIRGFGYALRGEPPA